MAPWVLHVDLDAFLASVERLRHPELVGRPVIVGGRGDPTERAVVSTASYEARERGVRSGMPLRIAVRRCPEAVLLPVDKPHYEEFSDRVMATLRAFPGAVVEVLGWDEAFLGIHTDDPERIARALQQAVRESTELSCAVGIGDTLVRAKTATGFGKPGGVFRLDAGSWLPVMGERDVTDLWGIGPRVGARLAALGIRTVAQLAAADVAALVAEFGPVRGNHCAQLGRGTGRRTVDDTPWVARGHSRQTTYQRDLLDRAEVVAALQELAEQVAADLRSEGRAGTRLTLTVRWKPFRTLVRQRVLAAPTSDAGQLAAVAVALYDALADPAPVRLLGIRVEMQPPPGGYEAVRPGRR